MKIVIAKWLLVGASGRGDGAAIELIVLLATALLALGYYAYSGDRERVRQIVRGFRDAMFILVCMVALTVLLIATRT